LEGDGGRSTEPEKGTVGRGEANSTLGMAKAIASNLKISLEVSTMQSWYNNITKGQRVIVWLVAFIIGVFGVEVIAKAVGVDGMFILGGIITLLVGGYLELGRRRKS